MSFCKLIIQDEVNIKFEGLTAEVRRKLSNTFKFEKPGAKYHPAYKLGRWDGTTTLFGVGGNGYLAHLPRILDVLQTCNYEISEIVDQRHPVQLNFGEVTETYWADRGIVWPKGHPEEGKPVMLRDYQVSAINTFLKNPQSLQEIATGAGKTITTATLSHICESIGRTITIVPNKGLVEQTEEDFINCGLDVGVYYGDRKDLNKTHTICTWQSLNILNKKSKNDEHDILSLAEFLDGVQTVIVDECFSGDSQVLTPSGYVEIRSLSPGDKVINYSQSSGLFKEDVVVKLHSNLTTTSSEQMYKLEFDSGELIEVTGNHKFLTSAGWVRADQLTEHHTIIDINSKTNINTVD